MAADASRPLYADMGSYLAARFPYKVQKISLHAGFSCPNRDGTKGRGGCTYCNNQTFSPDYCHTGRSITEQLDEGIAFFARKYPDMKYLAYFQAYTNTYGATPYLAACYEEALAHDGVVGLIIGTRPDCMPPDLLAYLSDNFDYVVRYCEERIPQIKTYAPDATYLMWLDCRDLGLSNEELRTFMIEKAKLGFNEGWSFGRSLNGYMRLNAACPRSVLEQAMKQLEAAVKSL